MLLELERFVRLNHIEVLPSSSTSEICLQLPLVKFISRLKTARGTENKIWKRYELARFNRLSHKCGRDRRDTWLERMEAAFAMGIQDAGLQPGEEPIPAQEEMREIFGQDGVDVLEILHNGIVVGGAAVTAAEQGRRSLELFFIDAGQRGRGMGAFAWKAIEEKYPDTEIWETETPYFEQRNIHFYMNICGFHAVEFFHPGHQPKENHPNHLPEGAESECPVPDYSFRFEKRMTHHVSHWS